MIKLRYSKRGDKEMKENFFRYEYGVIISCDVESLSILENLLRGTLDIEGMVGYKVGCILALRYGLPEVVKTIRKYSNSPVIYDHQKAGTDIPMTAPDFAKVCKNAGVESVIVFPQSGPEAERFFINSILEERMIPIIGGEMTHPKYLAKDSGFLRDESPLEMYRLGAKLGVKYFVVPGNKPESIQRYSELLSKMIEKPRFLLPGIGRQGGNIETAFQATKGKPSYAIIGSAIYKAEDIREAAKNFCKVALNFTKNKSRKI